MYENVRIYQGVTAQKFEQLLVDVKAAGATVDGNSITLKGVQVEYTLGSSSLALRIVHKAFPSNLMGNDKIFALIEAHARLSQ